MPNKPIILGLCTANRCRSQLFEALMKFECGDRCDVISAGSISTNVHPLAIKVLDEIGVPVMDQFSKTFNIIPQYNELKIKAPGRDKIYRLSDVKAVFTLCGSANDTCPIFPGHVFKAYWPIDDPDQYKGSDDHIIDHFRAARDDIVERIKSLQLKKVIG